MKVKIIGVDKVIKDLARIDVDIRRSGRTNVDKISELTKYQLMFYSPVGKTGETMNAWAVTSKRTTKNYVQNIVGLRYIPHEERVSKSMWKGENGTIFNINRWMLESPRALRHFRSGDINELRRVVPKNRARFFRQIEIDINKIIR